MFTKRMVVQIREDQRTALQRIAVVLDLSVSDVVRWFIDEGTNAVESTPSYANLEKTKEKR